MNQPRRRAYLGKPGLTDVGYSVYNADNTLRTARTTEGVAEMLALPGWYDVPNMVPDDWVGYIVWDSPAVPRPSVEEIDTRPEEFQANLKPEESHQLGYIYDRLLASAPNGEPATFTMEPPPDEGVARLFFFVRDFNVKKDLTFTVTMEAPAPVALAGAYEYDRTQTVTTVDGKGYVDIYPSPVLAAAGLPAHYIVKCDKIALTGKRLYVPAGGSNAATLPHVPPN